MAKVTSLRQFRISLSLTQKQMAFIIGTTRKTYREKELGHYPFSQEEIIRLVDYFDLSADDIYNFFYLTAKTYRFYSLYISKKIHYDS